MSNRYTQKMRCVNLVLSLLIATIVMVPGAMAYGTYLIPMNALYGPGLSCGTCHVDPNVGGPRTTYGTLFENQANHAADPAAALTIIGSPTPVSVANKTGSRVIDSSVLTAGSSTNVTVTVQTDITQSLSLKETIPSGWNLTNIKGEESMFKPSTNEWTWFTVTAGTPVVAKYRLTVPSGTAPGIYNIDGVISTANASDPSVAVTGDSIMTVTGATVEDTTAPTTEVSGATEGGVYIDNVTITLTATDNVGGSGVKNTTFSLNGAATETYSAPITVTNVGQNNLTYMSTDNAGNVENIKQINFTVNKAVPVFGIVFDAETYSFITGQGSAAISATVTQGAYNISQVEFGIVNNNSLNDKSADTVLIYYKDLSGKSGLYGPQNWAGEYVNIYTNGNVAVSDIVTPDIVSGSSNVRGVFNANNTSKDIDVVLSFDTTGTLSNVTDSTGKLLTIQNGNSTFRARTTRFTNGTFELVNSTNVFKLYNMSGNSAVDNPNIAVETAAVGQYTVYAFAKDVENNVTNDSAVISVNPVPVDTGNRGNGGSSGGTYTTPTATPVPTINVTTVPTTTVTPEPTVTVEPTTVQPVETTSEVPIEPIATKGSPGIGAIAVIGIIGTIYIIRRRK